MGPYIDGVHGLARVFFRGGEHRGTYCMEQEVCALHIKNYTRRSIPAVGRCLSCVIVNFPVGAFIFFIVSVSYPGCRTYASLAICDNRHMRLAICDNRHMRLAICDRRHMRLAICNRRRMRLAICDICDWQYVIIGICDWQYVIVGICDWQYVLNDICDAGNMC